MKTDFYTKTCLTLIAGSLLVIATQNVITPVSANSVGGIQEVKIVGSTTTLKAEVTSGENLIQVQICALEEYSSNKKCANVKNDQLQTLH